MYYLDNWLRSLLRYWGFSQFFDVSKIIRGTARSWGSSQLFWCLRRSWRRLRSGQGLFAGCSLTVNFRAIWWGFNSSRYSWRSPILSPGRSFPPLLSGGFLQYLACPKRIPVLSGLQNPQRDCSAPERYVMGSLLYAFLYCCSATKKVYWDLFPALRRAYFGGCLSSSLCRGGEN